MRRSRTIRAARVLLAGASLVGLAVFGVGGTGCATSKGSDESAEEAAASGAAEREGAYGDDPIGLAHRWADDPPEDAPESARKALETWDRPEVVRVSRREDGSYRAVIARSGSSEAEAVLLVIERGAEGWRVTGAEEGSATYLWPEM